MNEISTVASKLFESIRGTDLLMLVVALVTLAFMVATIVLANNISKQVEDWKIKRNVLFSRNLLVHTRRVYTIFLTLISLFPLLGMLGTVAGLLGLDLAGGDMGNIKNNFFIALTSTAWGIIFSVIFKFANSFFSDFIEEQIENAKEFSKDLSEGENS